MKALDEIFQEWSTFCKDEPDFIADVEEKVLPLLEHPDEDFVKQGMDLLGSFETHQKTIVQFTQKLNCLQIVFHQLLSRI